MVRVEGNVSVAADAADTSVEKDRDVTFPLYAKAGIPEAWLVHVTGSSVDIYRRPSVVGYQDMQRLQRGETVTPQALPDLVRTVADLLGP